MLHEKGPDFADECLLGESPGYHAAWLAKEFFVVRTYRMAVVVSPQIAYGRGLLRGILSCPQHPYQVVFTTWPVAPRLVPEIRKWRPDGIIAQLDDQKFARKVQSFDVPTVNVGNDLPELRRVVAREPRDLAIPGAGLQRNQ